MLADIKIDQDEYKEFLGWKLSILKDRQKKTDEEIAEIEKVLANGFSVETKDHSFLTKASKENEVVKNTRNSIGWKYKIQEVLGRADSRLTSSQIVSRICDMDSTINPDVATKSVGSALSTNSKNKDSMFIKETIQGVFYYINNPDYKE